MKMSTENKVCEIKKELNNIYLYSGRDDAGDDDDDDE